MRGWTAQRISYKWDSAAQIILQQLTILEVRFCQFYLHKIDFRWRTQFSTDLWFFERLVSSSPAGVAQSLTYEDQVAFDNRNADDFFDFRKGVDGNRVKRFNIRFNELCKAVYECVASVLRLVLAKPLRVSTAYYVRSGEQV